MKKSIAIIMILLSLGTAAFASFSLRGGFSYDFVNIKSADSNGDPGEIWQANALGAELGVAYNFSDHFLIYSDTTLGFFSKFTHGGTEVKKEDFDNSSFLSTSGHVGAAYDFNMANGLVLQVGAGFAYHYSRITGTNKLSDTVSESREFGVYGIGFGIFGNVGYRFSDKVSVTLTVHPDFMLLSGDIFKTTDTVTIDNTVIENSLTETTIGSSFSFKSNASAGVSFKF